MLAANEMPDTALSLPAFIQNAYGQGIAEVFLIGAPMAVIAFVCVLLLKEVPLGSKSGVQQRLEREADDDVVTTP
jgi:hypothetical protein